MLGWSSSNLRARRGRLTRSPGNDAAPRFVRIGGAVRYSMPELGRWLQRHPEYQGRREQLDATISQDDVCAMLKIGRSTLRECRAKRRAGDAGAAPPHVQVGQEIRYRESDVQSWITRHAVVTRNA